MPHVDTPQSVCRFGLARCDITPPVGIYHRMWGAATHDRATGVHRPLTATAMVLQAANEPPGSDTEITLLAVDHCLLWAAEMDELLQSLSRQTNLPVERFLVAFSHSHAGGLIDKSRAHLPGGDLIAPYLDDLAKRLVTITQEARGAVLLATLTYAHGLCTMAAQRD